MTTSVKQAKDLQNGDECIDGGLHFGEGKPRTQRVAYTTRLEDGRVQINWLGGGETFADPQFKFEVFD